MSKTFPRMPLAGLALCVALAGPAAAASSGIDLSSRDLSIPPATDFYRHINGGWLERTEIPADRAEYGAFSELDDRARQQLRVILDEAATQAGESARLQKLGAIYASFMDIEKVNARGARPLDADLQFIDVALKTRADLARVMGHLSRLGADVPVGGFITRDAQNPELNILYLTQRGLGLPDRDYYLKDETQFVAARKAYRRYVAQMLQGIGTPDAGAVAADILRLETALAKAQWSRVEARDAVKSYNRHSPAQLAALGGAFDLPAVLAASDVPAGDVVVRQPSFFAALGEIFGSTSVATLREYLRLRLLEAYAPYLSDRFAEAHFDFYGRTLSGTDENEPRWKRGIRAVETAAGFLLGEEYVARHYPAEAARRMDAMIQNLIAAYGDSIRNLPWMSATTKEQALEKLANFRPKIGHPQRWRDYSALQVRADDLYGNMRRANLFEHQRQVSRVGQPADPDEWFMTPQTVNAYYSPTANEIVFPAAILQAPFFNVDADDAVNYGAIGAVIGHEIGHGFDDQGSRYDGSGTLRNWWTDEDRARFEERTKILIAQYSAFEPLPGHHVNGALTIGENIGDIGGLSIAYDAWRRSLDGQPSPTLDGLTGAQRFFAGWAQIWRRHFRDPELIKRLKSAPHSPSEFRVNGVVVHIPAFYEAYNVQPEDPLYRKPAERVRIW